MKWVAIAVIFSLAVASWLFRYAPLDGDKILDRWTGNVSSTRLNCQPAEAPVAEAPATGKGTGLFDEFEKKN